MMLLVRLSRKNKEVCATSPVTEKHPLVTFQHLSQNVF